MRNNIVSQILSVVLMIITIMVSVCSALLIDNYHSNADSIYSALNDPSTSDIESKFSFTSSECGKLFADKTVLYKTDEFNAFNSYDDGEFSVELSALMQSKRELVEKEVQNYHIDVVFVLDVSGSMQTNYISGSDSVTRLEAACNAINQSINLLKQKDSEARFGIVVYNNSFRKDGEVHYDWISGDYCTAENNTGLYLPLNNYSLKYEDDIEYITFNKVRKEGEVESLITGDTVKVSRGTKTAFSADGTTFYAYFTSFYGTRTYYVYDSDKTTQLVKTTSSTETYGDYTFTFARNGSYAYFTVTKTTNTGQVGIIDDDAPTPTYEGASYYDNAGNKGFICASQMLMIPDGNGGTVLYKDYSSQEYTNYSEARGGTYTQAGLQAAQNMLISSQDADDRCAVIIHVTDGYPTNGDDNYKDVDLELAEDGKHIPSLGNGRDNTNILNIRTIQTAIYTKQQVEAKYGKCFFYSIGLGLESLVSQTVLDPSEENLSACKDSGTDTTYDLTATSTAVGLYNAIQGELTEEELQNLDYCDWSASGSITEQQLDEACSTIINSIKMTQISPEVISMLSSGEVVFTDIIADGMELKDAPVLIYNEIVCEAISTSVDGNTTICEYEYATVKIVGNQIYWSIKSNYIPAIIEDLTSSEITWAQANPIRLLYKVGLAGDNCNEVYYVTPIDKPAIVEFSVSSQNEYEFNLIEEYKVENTTSTKSYSIQTTQNNSSVQMLLGNNGLLTFYNGQLNPDEVVIDYGLPVDIDIVANDSLRGTVTAISADIQENTQLNNIFYEESRLLNNSCEVYGLFGKFSLDGSVVTYTLNSMNMTEKDDVYYEVAVQQDEVVKYIYSTISVIPATSIFFEDNLISFSDDWSVIKGVDVKQDCDRLGLSDIESIYDANNVYGYDSSNLNSTTYSLGSIHYTEVTNSTLTEKGKLPTAVFTFTGVAFDLISLTSSNSGVIICNVYKGTDTTQAYKSWIVDTYYGISRVQNEYVKHTWTYGEDGKWHVVNTIVEESEETDESQKIPSNIAAIDTAKTYITYEKNYEWTSASQDSDNALYQIPVISSPELEYGTYTVQITTAYSTFFDHHYTIDSETGKRIYGGKYSVYIDAVKVYQPAEDYEGYNQQYYTKDSEGWPQYINVKNTIVQNSEQLDSDYIDGICFIDSVASSNSVEDYKLYGPNNELYLTSGQSISFSLKADCNDKIIDKIQIGAKQIGGEDSQLTISTGAGENIQYSSCDIKCSTDMYYSISNNFMWTDGVSDLITITNSSSGCISITNIKITFKDAVQESVIAFCTQQMYSDATLINQSIYINSISQCIHRYSSCTVAYPTYDDFGIIKYTCIDCGYEYYTYIDKLIYEESLEYNYDAYQSDDSAYEDNIEHDYQHIRYFYNEDSHTDNDTYAITYFDQQYSCNHVQVIIIFIIILLAILYSIQSVYKLFNK